jgi:hypothetical protein
MNYIITEETLLLQKRAGIITESQYKEKLEGLIKEFWFIMVWFELTSILLYIIYIIILF